MTLIEYLCKPNTFNAYIIAPSALDANNTIYLLIGTTSATTYIDTVAPTINEIRYYEYDPNEYF